MCAKKTVYFVSILTLIIMNVGCRATKEDLSFKNPVVLADVPDVDVIRVDDDYFMISTTMHMMPGAPIMHSKDLVNWEIISYLYDSINERPQNNLEDGAIYGLGQWASSLRYHNGTYYAFFGTNYKSYLYTTTDPFKGWTLKTAFDKYYHDPSILFDDNGKIYLAYGAGHVRIVEFLPDMSGINPDGLNVEVVHGEPKGLLEGVHFYKFNGQV